MAIRLLNVPIVFDSGLAGPLGFRNIQRTVSVPSVQSILRAEVALNGFAINYTNKDHHLRSLLIDTDILAIRNPNQIDFQIQVALTDKKPDDPFEGWVSVLVIAEVVELPVVETEDPGPPVLGD